MTGARVRVAFRGAFRSIRASGRNVMVVVAALAVAAGASQAVWIVWDEVVARPLPFPDAEQLVELIVEEAAPGRPPMVFDLEVPFLAEHTTLFQSVGAWQWNRVVVSDGANLRAVLIAETGPGVLDMLRVPPAAGRLPVEEDHPSPEQARREGTRVIVLSHRLARGLYSSPSEAVGSEILLDDRPARVIAVMPPRFVFPEPRAEAWTPAPVLRSGPLTGLVSLRSTNVVGRLHPDAAPQAAAEEATAVLHRAGMPAPLQRDKVRLGVRRVSDQLAADFRPSLEALRAGALLLLLVGAVGASSLRASQAIGERRAAWVRRSLGASFTDEVLTAVARVTLLGALVGVAGGLVAGALTPLLRPALAHLGDQGLTGIRWSLVLGGVLVAAAGVALAEFFAFAMASRSGTPDRGGTRATTTRAGARDSLALTALAASAATVLAVGTAVLVTSARHTLRGDFAVPFSRLAQLDVHFAGPTQWTSEETLDRVMERVLALPGVEAAGYGIGLPHAGSGELIGGGSLDGNEEAGAILRRINPSLLATLGIPVEEGRGLLATDRQPAEAVAVIDRRLAQRLGEGSALDRFLTTQSSDQVRVVGVVPEIEPVLQGGMRPDGVALAHFSRSAPGPLGAASVQVVARCDAPCSDDMVATLRNAVSGVDSQLRVLAASTLEQRRTSRMGAGLLTSVAIAVFGGAGLLLSVVGMLGQTWNEIGARSRSLAIRHALGATPRAVRREAVRGIRSAALFGVGLGTPAAWFLARLLGSRMEWVDGGGLLVFLAPAAAVAACALAASALGARRIDLTNLRQAIRTG